MKEEEVVAAMNEVMAMSVTLDQIPTPPALQIQIVTTRGYLGTARRHLNRMRKMHNLLRTELSTMEMGFNLDYIELMATDPEVQAGGSVTDRKALAHYKLREQIKKIESKRIEVVNFDAAEKVVWEVIKNLEGTSTDISRQMKLIRLDEALAGGGGDKGRDEESGSDSEDGDLPSDDEDLLDLDEDEDPVTGTAHLDQSFGNEEDAVEPEEVPETVATIEKVIEAQETALKQETTPSEPIEGDEWEDLIEGVGDQEPEPEPEMSEARIALRRIVVTKSKATPKTPPATEDDLDDLLDDEI